MPLERPSDRLQELLGLHVLEEVPVRARLDAGRQVLARVAHREDHDAARRILVLECREDLHARAALHIEVEDRQVGFGASDELDRLLARARLAHDVKPLL